MLTVYPDGDSQLVSLLSDDILHDLKTKSEFMIYEGKPDVGDYIRRVKHADGILLGWGIPNSVIDACQRLKIISFMGIGAANFIDIDFAASKGIAVANAPGYGDNAIAEHSLALLMSVVRNIPEHDLNVKQGIWDQSRQGIEISGKTVGLIGLGNIGVKMARICKGIGLNVLCWTRRPDPGRARQAGVTFVELEELLKKSDFISLHLNYNKETRGFIGRKELSLMKRGAVLINTARAELIDTGALVDFLASGYLAGAGVDVFDEEPVSGQNPLKKFANVVLTPHVGFNTPEASKNLISISVKNLVEFYSGSPQNIINPGV